MNGIPGRKLYVESLNHPNRNRDAEFLRYWREFLLANQRHKLQLSELPAFPVLKDDRLDLNFTVFEDYDRVHPHSIYFNYQTYDLPIVKRSYGFSNDIQNRSTRYLLEYIKQMEENYAAMERELLSTKMLAPLTSRQSTPRYQKSFPQKSQAQRHWENDPAAEKRGNSYRIRSGIREKLIKGEGRNREKIYVPSWKEKNGNSMGRVSNDFDLTKRHGSPKNLEENECYLRSPSSHACRPKIWNNATAVCSRHNVAVILPGDSRESIDVSVPCAIRTENTERAPEATDKFSITKETFNPTNFVPPNLLKKSIQPNKNSEKTLMDTCQSLDQKHKPETSCRIDFGVNHEDHGRPNRINPLDSKGLKRARLEDTPGNLQFHNQRPSPTLFNNNRSFNSTHSPLGNTNICRRSSHVNRTLQDNRNPWNNRVRRTPYERARSVKDATRNSGRTMHKNVRTQRTPTPRSNVHTACSPMAHSFPPNPILDPSGFTIQLLRLAVLLYAPALMPALNSLIARQNSQSTLPVPYFEGSNDLLAQVFRILNSQQYVPNLPYTPSCNPRFPESPSLNVDRNLPNLPENFEIPNGQEVMVLPDTRKVASLNIKSRTRLGAFGNGNEKVSSELSNRVESQHCAATNLKSYDTASRAGGSNILNARLLLPSCNQNTEQREHTRRKSSEIISIKRSINCQTEENEGAKNN